MAIILAKSTLTAIETKNDIADYFGTDDCTTARISDNLCFGFFRHHFGDDADNKWNEAHPFAYPGGGFNPWKIDPVFIKKHFALFAGLQLKIWAGWGEYDDKKGIVPWVTRIFYQPEKPTFGPYTLWRH